MRRQAGVVAVAIMGVRAVMMMHDIFRRGWNDVRAGLPQAGCWWAVLLTTIVYNMTLRSMGVIQLVVQAVRAGSGVLGEGESFWRDLQCRVQRQPLEVRHHSIHDPVGQAGAVSSWV